MTRLNLAGLLAALALALSVTAMSHASTVVKAPVVKLAPPWVCTMANRLEIFVDEDNIMYACECEALSTGHTCRWQVIGGVEAVNNRKRIKARYHVRVVPRGRLLVIA